MKTKSEINNALDKLYQKSDDDLTRTKFQSMTYEQGVEEALIWVLGDLSDMVKSYCKKQKESGLRNGR